ncbi:hypothetical protein CBL_07536 [Carabus blaptoides fortunei]
MAAAAVLVVEGSSSDYVSRRPRGFYDCGNGSRRETGNCGKTEYMIKATVGNNCKCKVNYCHRARPGVYCLSIYVCRRAPPSGQADNGIRTRDCHHRTRVLRLTFAFGIEQMIRIKLKRLWFLSI